MKRNRTAFAGIVCGFLCAACVLAYTQGVRGEAEAARAEALARYGGEQLEVCVAKRDIAAGETVDAAAVEIRMWVADLLPAEAVRSVDDAVGRKVASSIVAGEVMTERRFGEVGAELDVPEGLTAVSVPAKDVQAVGGAVGAGSRVDMYATGGTSTDVIARSVLVLATSAGGSTSDTGVTWIVVAVAPESVQEVVTAAQKTELYFTLPGDEMSAKSDAEKSGDAGEERASVLVSKKPRKERSDDVSRCTMRRYGVPAASGNARACGREPCGAGVAALVCNGGGGPQVLAR